jgi:hypothetical protein
MQQPTDKLRVNILGMLIAVVGFGLVAAFVTIAFSAQDPLWFIGGYGFEERPARIVIYQAGQRTELRPGQPGYTELAEAVRASLAQGVVRTSGIGLSEGSLQDAYSQFLTVETFFSRSVKLHAAFNTDYPTQMLFPITGRHSDQPIVFLGKDGTYMSGAPVLKTVQPIRDVLTALGYLQ